ncbi:MAG: dephospho-CoA kinase [Bryobacteraceae bacterium]
MLKVGLTGGIGTGKSFVAAALAELGCHVIEADALGHQVLEPSGEAYQAVVAAFGRGVLNADETIDRKKLGRQVFGNVERLALLNSLVHPAVFRRQDELMRSYGTLDPGGIVVVVAAIMIEAGSFRRYDRLVVAVCDPETQIQRAMKRDGASREEVLARMQSQMPLDEKRKYADYVIDTSGTKEETIELVKPVYQSLRSECL